MAQTGLRFPLGQWGSDPGSQEGYPEAPNPTTVARVAPPMDWLGQGDWFRRSGVLIKVFRGLVGEIQDNF